MSLLSDDHPVFGVNGTYNSALLPKAMQPKNLQDYLNGNIAEGDFGFDGSPLPARQPRNILKNYEHPDIAAGDCYETSLMLLRHMPMGSRLLKLDEEHGGGNGHYAIQTPTTDGHVVTDFTHRQFGVNSPSDKSWTHKAAGDIPFPLVEPKDSYMNRDTIVQGFGNEKGMPERQVERMVWE